MSINLIYKLKRYKTFTLNTSSLFILNGLSFVLSIVILPRLINNFGIYGWGEISFSQIIINYFIWFIDWSFPQYACKQISIYENRKYIRKYIFTLTRTSQFILFLISSFLILFYGLIISSNSQIYINSILILFGSFLQSYWYLNGREKIYETAFFQFLNKIIFTFFIFKFLNISSNISEYFYYLGLASIITGVLFNIRIILFYKEEIKFAKLKPSIKLIKNTLLLFNSSIIGNLTVSCLPFLIGNFYSTDLLGIYNIGDRIKNLSIQIVNPLNNSIFPKMSKFYFKNKEQANNKLIRFTYIILLLGIFIFTLINLNTEFIVTYFAKEKIDEIKNIVKILSFSFLFNIIYETFINQYLIINNLFKDITKIKLITLLTSILAGVPLIFYKGIYGAAITSIIYELVALICAINIFIKTKN